MRLRSGLVMWGLVLCLVLPTPCEAQSAGLGADFNDGASKGAAVMLLAGGGASMGVAACLLFVNALIPQPATPGFWLWTGAFAGVGAALLIAGGVFYDLGGEEPADPTRAQAYNHGFDAGLGDGLIGVGSLILGFGLVGLISNKPEWNPWTFAGLGALGVIVGVVLHISAHEDFDELKRVQSGAQPAALHFSLLSFSF